MLINIKTKVIKTTGTIPINIPIPISRCFDLSKYKPINVIDIIVNIVAIPFSIYFVTKIPNVGNIIANKIPNIYFKNFFTSTESLVKLIVNIKKILNSKKIEDFKI